MLLTTVLTAPRPDKIEYFPQTLAAFEEKNAAAIVFRDGNATGSRRMMGSVLRYFAARSEYQRLLYCEDDILPCTGLVDYAEAVTLREEWPMLSFFDPRIADRRQQLLSMNVPGFLYTQCLLFTREAAEKLADLSWDTDSPRKGKNGASVLLGQQLHLLDYKTYGLHLPNLVKHIGDQSAVLNGKTRVPGNPTFPGFDFQLERQHS